MGNPRKKTKVTLKTGEDRLLAFDGNALAELEDLIGQKILALLIGFQDKSQIEVLQSFGYKELRACLYCGMIGAGSRTTLENVGKFMYSDSEHLLQYMNAISEALVIATSGKTMDELAEFAAEQAKDKEPEENPTSEKPSLTTAEES